MCVMPVSITVGLIPIPIFAAADDNSDKQQLKGFFFFSAERLQANKSNKLEASMTL